YRAGTRYEDERHRRNSLFLIATNLARDFARHQRHARTVPLPDGDDEHHELAAPADPFETRADLGRAIAQLAPRQREVLWLAYAQGASHAEIAHTLGLRAQSIKTLLFRARKKLAALLR